MYWAARKGKWSPRGTGTAIVLAYPCPTASRVSVAVRSVRQGNRQGWCKRSKFREQGRRAHHGQDRRLPGPASDLIKGGDQGNLAPGSLSTWSPAGRTPLHGDGSMLSQAYERINGPSAAVRDRGH